MQDLKFCSIVLSATGTVIRIGEIIGSTARLCLSGNRNVLVC